jgi:hypothetical protein
VEPTREPRCKMAHALKLSYSQLKGDSSGRAQSLSLRQSDVGMNGSPGFARNSLALLS